MAKWHNNRQAYKNDIYIVTGRRCRYIFAPSFAKYWPIF